MRIGDHVFIGENSVISAADIGSYVYIGKNVVIVSVEYFFLTSQACFLEMLIVSILFQGRRCILKDCCMIEDNTILPPETVVPSFTKYDGSPGRCVGELPECTQELMTEFTRSYYQHFIPERT